LNPERQRTDGRRAQQRERVRVGDQQRSAHGQREHARGHERVDRVDRPAGIAGLIRASGPLARRQGRRDLGRERRRHAAGHDDAGHQRPDLAQHDDAHEFRRHRRDAELRKLLRPEQGEDGTRRDAEEGDHGQRGHAGLVEDRHEAHGAASQTAGDEQPDARHDAAEEVEDVSHRAQRPNGPLTDTAGRPKEAPVSHGRHPNTRRCRRGGLCQN
jgi:hypothetical protein